VIENHHYILFWYEALLMVLLWIAYAPSRAFFFGRVCMARNCPVLPCRSPAPAPLVLAVTGPHTKMPEQMLRELF
jgi:hypothetical protein